MAKKDSYHVMVKPIGPICNLRCEYCFYLDKQSLYPDQTQFRMSDELLERYVQQYIASQPGPMVSFAWQGGEPTLMGLDFFQQVVELQAKYLPAGWQCENAFQTNGVLLDDDWCQFFRKQRFLVGLSMDGPEWIHDRYRKDRSGQGSHPAVMRALKLLQHHGVEYNILCVVNQLNAKHPVEVYNFFKDQGVEYMQFIPIVELLDSGRVSSRSVAGKAYGQFLTAIFNEWLAGDMGRIFVQIFEEALAACAGYGASLCLFQETCGKAMVLEHNGDLYACDHFVEPDCKLGNIMEAEIIDLAKTPRQEAFGLSKKDDLAERCQKCSVRFICNGGCPKNRRPRHPSGEANLNYLCDGYKQFFSYARPFLTEMAAMMQRRYPLDQIARRVQHMQASMWQTLGRNDLCPCGSGQKYKKCCARR